jgi:hypothetical protein
MPGQANAWSGIVVSSLAAPFHSKKFVCLDAAGETRYEMDSPDE